MYRQEWNDSSDGPVRHGGPFALTPWVRRLLIANATVFLLTLTVFTGDWVVLDFGFIPSGAWERPWTFLTYLFIHGSLIHLGMNMFMLFFFGPPVEERLGGTTFARYYFFCGFGGAALSLALGAIWATGPTIGASGAVFGVSLAFAMFWPNTPIFIFPFPVPIKAKWLVIGLASLDLIMQISPGRDGIAHLAHLGGFLFGLVYFKGLPLLAQHTNATAERKREAIKVLAHRAPENDADGSTTRRSAPHPPPTPQASKENAVDRILDKISRTGMDSLTPDERRVLTDRSEQLQRD